MSSGIDPSPSPAAHLLESLDAAEERARAVAGDIEGLREQLHAVRVAVAEADAWRAGLPFAGHALVRAGVLASLAGLLLLTLWAGAVDYARRVTSDTPTFIALVADMAQKPFAKESPFLDAAVATQHATPYLQLLAFVWRALPGSGDSPGALSTFLALVGVAVFGFLLWCVFLYVRRLAGTTAAWISLPVLLGVFGPPHVIWASDLSLHAALYAGFFPQNLAMATMLLALLALDRRSLGSLAGACALASLTMLVHPFTGVLLCVLATVDGCRLAAERDRNALALADRAGRRLRRGARVAGVLPRSRLRRDRSARCRLHRALHCRAARHARDRLAPRTASRRRGSCRTY